MRGVKISKGEALRYLQNVTGRMWGFIYETKENVLLHRKHISGRDSLEKFFKNADEIYISDEYPVVITTCCGGVEYILIIPEKNQNIRSILH